MLSEFASLYMPFTFAHPALIIPLCYARQRHGWLSATGLITGSVAPDFEKFLRLKLASSYSHTIASIFYFSCPVSLALAFVFHLLVRRPLIAHLPLALYYRLSRYQDFNWPNHFRQHYWGVLLSIVIGAALHLFWDGFTHFHASINELLPSLNNSLQVGRQAIPLFKIVGLISSTFGIMAIVIVVWLMPMYPSRPPFPTAVRYYWIITTLVTVAFLTERLLLVRTRLLDGGITFISAAMIGVIVASIFTDRFMTKMVE